MTHKIPKDVKNSNIEYCIREYVRLEKDRELLRKKWFEGATIEELAAFYKTGETRIKEILYGIGDEILIRASEME